MSMMGKHKFFLGLQIKQVDELTNIHELKYVKKLLKRFKLEEAKSISTPMHPITSLRLNKKSNLVDIIEYRQMIRSLLYLTTFRLDITFNICLFALYLIVFCENSIVISLSKNPILHS